MYKVVKIIGKNNAKLVDSVSVSVVDSAITYKGEIVVKEADNGVMRYVGDIKPGTRTYEFIKLIEAASDEYKRSIWNVAGEAAKDNNLPSAPEEYEMQTITDDSILTYENEMYQSADNLNKVAETVFGSRDLTQQERRELGGIRDFIRSVKEDRRERQRHGIVKKSLEESKAEIRANNAWIKDKIREAEISGSVMEQELWKGYQELLSQQIDYLNIVERKAPETEVGKKRIARITRESSLWKLWKALRWIYGNKGKITLGIGSFGATATAAYLSYYFSAKQGASTAAKTTKEISNKLKEMSEKTANIDSKTSAELSKKIKELSKKIDKIRVLKGDQGKQGETGKTGEKGDQGKQGETGKTGGKGDQGRQGEMGKMGQKGDQGEERTSRRKGESWRWRRWRKWE